MMIRKSCPNISLLVKGFQFVYNLNIMFILRAGNKEFIVCLISVVVGFVDVKMSQYETQRLIALMLLLLVLLLVLHWCCCSFCWRCRCCWLCCRCCCCCCSCWILWLLRFKVEQSLEYDCSILSLFFWRLLSLIMRVINFLGCD